MKKNILFPPEHDSSLQLIDDDFESSKEDIQEERAGKPIIDEVEQ